MNVAILTFQFAHNYGALLQAYALKTYLQNHNMNAEIAPYYPDWARAEYAISPFTKGVPPKRRVRLALQYFKRKKQSRVFSRFIEEELKVNDAISEQKELVTWLDRHDCVICGSDQIWNNNITGDCSAYYAGGCKTRRISYAASLGTLQLTEVQKDNIKANLPYFSEISVREPSSATKIAELIQKEVRVVLDPVFLLKKDEWRELAKPVAVESNYVLVYFLQENEELLNYAKAYAQENNLRIYDIHPTMSKKHSGCRRLNNVGPKEFVWLIQNASCVCTNSFHATAFSVIFEKKLIHIPNGKSPERTISLLNRAGLELKKQGEFPFYDLGKCDSSSLYHEISESKVFIENALRRENNAIKIATMIGDNYGSALQAFALQQSIKECGGGQAL